jgi:hypothetical protein
MFALMRFNNYFEPIRKATILNILVQAGNNFGLGFAAFFFKTHGVELYKIILVWAISPLVSLPIVMFCNKWSVRRYLRYGLLAFVGMSLSLLFFNRYSFILYGVCYGLKLALFSVSFNYIFFRHSASHNHAKNSSMYFIFGPLLGVILPPVGAVMIGNLGFRAIFLATTLLTFLPLFYASRQHFDRVEKQSWRSVDKAFAGFRMITFFDGALHFFQSNFLAIYALLFLKNSYQVGGLLSYLALISLAVSFALAHVSDHSRWRAEILYPLLIPMGLLIFMIPALQHLRWLIVVIGLYATLDNLSLPIRFAVPMDFVKLNIGFWRASEFYSNVGRTVVFAIAALLLYMGNTWLPFMIFGLMTVAFPFLISRKIRPLRTGV